MFIICNIPKAAAPEGIDLVIGLDNDIVRVWKRDFDINGVLISENPIEGEFSGWLVAEAIRFKLMEDSSIKEESQEFRNFIARRFK